MEVRVFRNPANGHEERVDTDPLLGTFFFGGIYLLLKGLWAHAVFWWIMVSVTLALTKSVGAMMFVGFVLSVAYTFAIRGILARRYLRDGWSEPSAFNPPGEWMPQAPEAGRKSTSHSATTKRCPYCAEEILAAAIRCKHCQADLTAKARGDECA